MLQSQSQWMNASMPTTMSKDIDKYLWIEQPSTFGKDESGNNVIKAEKFDFDLFSNSWGVFELEQWILTNQSRSWDPTKCISDYLTNEAVDEQFKSKLARLNQLKARTEKLDQDMKKERLKKLNDINKKMRYWMHEEEPFVAYEDKLIKK